MELFNIALFDSVTKDMYAPAYPLIARQIVERTGITSGHCLDIGTGCGYLGIALAGITRLHLTLGDVAPEAIARARKNVIAAGLAGRFATLLGDVHRLPLPDASVDLAVSRASMTFWTDMPAALGEVYRVLSPGGCAYLGGGFGTEALRESVVRQRAALNVDWHELTKLQVRKYTPETLEAEIGKAGLTDYRFFTDGGLWVLIRKPA